MSADEIARDATWLAQALDPSRGLVRLVAMDRESYRAASFLDDRMLQSPLDAQLVPWIAIEEAITPDLRSDARWIFHIGHVGSTLVSRLLGELDGVLAVREPRLLRDLALTPPDIRQRYIVPAPQLMSRTFAQDQFACVKATSFASEIAPQLVPSGERALFLFASARNYVASILAGENSMQELRILAGSRAQRLNGRGIHFSPQDDAQLAATSWACEMSALGAAAEAMSDRRIQWIDFDAMLRDMDSGLSDIAGFFGFGAEPERIRAIGSGPIMSRYSKAPEYEYSPALRRELIGETGERYRREIDGALAMLRSAAEKSPPLAQAMARAES